MKKDEETIAVAESQKINKWEYLYLLGLEKKKGKADKTQDDIEFEKFN